MRRRIILPAVLLLGFAIGCDASPDEESQQVPTDPAERADARLAACEGFYEGTGTPLAERADDARAALSAGEVTDDAAYSEINALEQRINELSRDADVGAAPVLVEINGPFTRAVELVNEAREQDVAEGEEAAFPDLSEIDVSGSESAQEQFRAHCEEAGYEFG